MLVGDRRQDRLDFAGDELFEVALEVPERNLFAAFEPGLGGERIGIAVLAFFIEREHRVSSRIGYILHEFGHVNREQLGRHTAMQAVVALVEFLGRHGVQTGLSHHGQPLSSQLDHHLLIELVNVEPAVGRRSQQGRIIRTIVR